MRSLTKSAHCERSKLPDSVQLNFPHTLDTETMGINKKSEVSELGLGEYPPLRVLFNRLNRQHESEKSQ